MRIFLGGIATETNTFAAFPTTMAAFEEHGVSRKATCVPGSILGGLMGVMRARAEADGHEVIEGLSAFAQPAGLVARQAYETLRDGLLDDLAGAGPLDVILLVLHGAMVAEHVEDCEGDLLTRVRAMAPHAVIGVELDPHCHLSETMVETADLIVIGKLFPHTDLGSCAAQLYSLALRTARQEIVPVAALLDTQMIGFYPTTHQPMAGLVAKWRGLECGRILSVNLAHGFPWADVADVGTRVLVYADGEGCAASRRALGVAQDIYAQREVLRHRLPALEDVLRRALASPGLTVLGDACDNPGGGAAGDSVFGLAALLRLGAEGAVFGALWDPEAVHLCRAAGEGREVSLVLGGHSGPAAGDPVRVTGTVMALREGYTSAVFGNRQDMGDAVWLRCEGIDVVVCSARAQTYAPDTFTGLGIDLADKRVVLVKSAVHYRADFAPLARETMSVATPGALRVDFEAIPYTRRSLDYFPRVPDPWARGEPAARIFPARTARAQLSGKA
ncbi:M81 family metallopeptidase [Novosphingobium mangrovi (ex Hu et al. 2023)]|uniref:Microcystinase C n=1 Tax=Novosphingobium mangrovi (ex Hu et al. 2023) TaxID=2930094 RepID=A0ABT0ACQ9_9SPHN|nr:M81 family metallopeptidase [Novosphingobium mangrovi (ex Hu et al. 2023)]MCJ1960981.1 M81 family metallopeptidase [Novosphingobium mangrovi (ex Hu et al. 2023)]